MERQTDEDDADMDTPFDTSSLDTTTKVEHNDSHSLVPVVIGSALASGSTLSKRSTGVKKTKRVS
jgi:hypothetical protein